MTEVKITFLPFKEPHASTKSTWLYTKGSDGNQITNLCAEILIKINFYAKTTFGFVIFPVNLSRSNGVKIKKV